MASFFSDLDEPKSETKKSNNKDFFSDLPEQPSKLRSALSGIPHGVLEAASSINPLSPRGPISPDLGEKLLEQFLPVRPEHKFLQRAGKLGTYAAVAPQGIVPALIETAGGTLLGEAAEKAGYGETGQTIAEFAGMGLPGLARSIGRGASQLAKGFYGKLGKGIKPVETPVGSPGYELAEEALKALEKPATEKPITGIEFPKIEPETAKPLTGRAKVIDDSIGKTISSDRFYNEKHGGINLSGNVKSEAKLERKPFEKKYKLAEKEFKGKNDIYAKLADENDSIIARLEEVPEMNAGEKAVYDKAQALRKMIGTRNALIEAPFNRLIRYSDSISGIANYDMPYVGPKGILKTMAKSLNKAVIEAADRQGLNTKHMLEADALYSKWADKFLNDEISPYLAHKMLNPEKLYRTALADEGAYRALRNAIGKNHGKTMGKLERGIVEVAVKPYVKERGKIDTPEFRNDMAKLEGLIGKPKATAVKNRLIKESTKPLPKEFPKVKSIEERIKSGNIKQGYVGKNPEHIEQMMNSRSGIRELRKELKARGQEELFDKLAEEKTLDIMRGGVVSPEKIRGIDMFNQIRQKHNYQILSEIYDKKVVDVLLADLSKINKKQIVLGKLFRLGKHIGTWAGAAKIIKVLSALI